MAESKRAQRRTRHQDADPDHETDRVNRTPVASPKRRKGALALSLALAVIGGLLTWVFLQSSGAEQYLRVNHAMERGDRIDRTQLSVVEVVGDPGHLIPVQRVDEIVGQIVVSDVAPGTPLTSGMLTTQLGVEEGRSVLGVAVAPGRLPSRALVAGDQVQIVFTPASENQADTTARPEPLVATVETTGRDDAGNRTIVDLSITNADAPTAAAWAAQDSVSLVLAAAATQGPQPAPQPTQATEDQETAEDQEPTEEPADTDEEQDQ